MEGYQIVEGEQFGGFRHFLDGEPLHPGNGIDLWVAGRWLPGRYESVRLPDRRQRGGVFHTRLFDQEGEEETAIPIQESMRFRWPSSETSDEHDSYTRMVQQVVQLRTSLREIHDTVRRALEDGDASDVQRLRDALADIGEQSGEVW